MTFQEHLDWLLYLMEPPYTNGWKAYCWEKANSLAESDAEQLAKLPATLAAAMKARQQESDSPTSGLEQQSTNQPRRSE